MLKVFILEEINLINKFKRHDLTVNTDKSSRRRSPAKGSNQDAQSQVLNHVFQD
jgi:hypothetical protein